MTGGQVFIVDDNASNLNLLAGVLRDAGHQVRVANNARRALAAVRASPPELILLDITMPEIDGYQLCAALKGDPATSDIPVIFISALDDVQDKVRAFQQGGVDYVSKPFQAEEVLARVGAQLGIARMRKELERKNAELLHRNEELEQARQRTQLVFSAFSEVLPGVVLDGKYRLESRIGIGGFGAVYRAQHIELGRAVAVKILRPPHSGAGLNPIGIDRFRREGISACRIHHPNAVSVLDFGICSAGIPYLVMELLEGCTLTSLLDGDRVLTVGRAAAIILPVCDVLATAHSTGIVHRDIKPDNIFLHQSQGIETVKVVDFGIAKLAQEADQKELTLTGQVVGTPHYMSPERLLGQPHDGQADVYSVGVVLYRMLTGRLPLAGAHAGVAMLAILATTQEPPPLRTINPAVPEAIEEVVLRALQRDPGRRPTAAVLLVELQAAGLRPDGASGPEIGPGIETQRTVLTGPAFGDAETLSTA